ncbi:hypothetical protein Tco_1326630 [Tanacetum coccineum]
MGDENPICTLGDYSRPSHEGYRNTIELPEGNNVVPFRFDTIRLVQNGCSFHRLRSEDPNQHLKDFLKLMDSLDLDGENRERMRLISVRSIDSFQGLTPKSPSTWHRSLAPSPIFYDHVNLVTRRTINQSAGGKLRDINLEESWAILKDLALYDNENWNDLKDFAKLVKAIALPQDVLSTSDCRLIELENQAQRFIEAHLAQTQPTQVNKITASCEICNGPHGTCNCTKDPEQACVDYASSHTNEIRGKKFTSNHGPRNFNDAANTWKDKPNFNRAHTQTFTSPQGGSISVDSSSYQMKLEKALLDFDSNQEKMLSNLSTHLEQQQDDMIGKINLLWKTVSEKLNDTSSPKNAGSSMAPRSIAAISHDKKEELRKKGIKSPSKLLSPIYLSPASIKELNKNPSSPKRVHFINLIVILSTDNDTEEEDASSTNVCNLDLGGMAKGKEELKEQGKEEKEMEADIEVEEEESEFETNEEVEEIIEEEEDDGDGEYFNLFPTMMELTHHEWLLKNPRPPWVKARIKTRSPNNTKISCMIGHFFIRHAYIDLESPINIMSRRQYNQIMTYELTSRQKPSNPKKISNFVGRIRVLKIFIGSFTYECDFMILEDTTSIIDRHLG